MGWTDPVDIYCERLSAAFWAEPFNAISNAAFIIAALLAWRTARRLDVRHADITALILLAGVIGIGSFLFHTFANGWSELADTIPIWSFVALFVLVAMHRIGGMKIGRVAVIAAGVAAVLVIALLATGEGDTTQAAAEPAVLNGSMQYAPAVIALLVFSFLGWRRQSPMAPWIWAATATFLISLGFRTGDIAFCDRWSPGTHFVWHLLNATMIGILLDGLIRVCATQATRATKA